MSTFGSATDNNDGSKNIEVGIMKENGANRTTGSLSATNYRDHHPITKHPTQMYDAVGASFNFRHDGNPSTAGSVSVQHIPKFGNTASASAGIGVGSETHRVGMEAFGQHNMPKVGPNFSTVGARVNAQAGIVGAHAGIAHTPMFRQTEHSVGARLNLHQTPTSSVHIGVGSNRITTPNNKGNWNHAALFGVQKKF